MIPPTASIKSFLLQASFLACCSEALRFPLPEQRILHTSSSPPQPPHENALPKQDCTIRCPPASPDGGKIVLPALTQTRNATGQWENTLECWAVDTVETEVPGIDNAFQLQWEGGFDAAYQYVFYGPSFMPPHPAPEPSLIVMGSGIGDLKVPSGKCLRVGAGDIFFSVGTEGRQTAWWAEGTVVSDFYFKEGKVPRHEVVDEMDPEAYYKALKAKEGGKRVMSPGDL